MKTNSVARRSVGVLAAVLLLAMIALSWRQYTMWGRTGDGYYLTSTMLYLVVDALLFSGAAWGFLENRLATQTIGVGVGLLGLLCIGMALFNWVTGFVLGRDAPTIFAAINWALAGFVLLALLEGLRRLSPMGETALD